MNSFLFKKKIKNEMVSCLALSYVIGVNFVT